MYSFTLIKKRSYNLASSLHDLTIKENKRYKLLFSDYFFTFPFFWTFFSSIVWCNSNTVFIFVISKGSQALYIFS